MWLVSQAWLWPQDLLAEMRIAGDPSNKEEVDRLYQQACQPSKDSFEGGSLKDGDCGPQLSEGSASRGEVYLGHGNLESSCAILEKARQLGPVANTCT